MTISSSEKDMKNNNLDLIVMRTLSAPKAKPKDTIRITAYNIERGLKIDEIIKRWKNHPISESDIVLLSEADNGMSRTDNRDITRDFAESLGYSNYVFGLEFIELTKGVGKERNAKGDNTLGYHGNAIVSNYKLYNPEVARLTNYYNWFEVKEKRIGTRIGLIADVEIGDRYITVASTHLENNASPENRKIQISEIISALKKKYKSRPAIIGGDMNTFGFDTSNALSGLISNFGHFLDMFKNPEKYESLLEYAMQQGFNYKDSNMMSYTHHLKGKPKCMDAHLDWFFVKNVKNSDILNPKIHYEFKGISDHYPISVEIKLS